MELGNKILEMRKGKKLSQEQLAEKINVTRQTISNWELGETNPNPKQLKLLSKVLVISIDELLDNDVKEIVIKKVSNVERLAGIIITALKILGILLVIAIIIPIISMFFFGANVKEMEEDTVTETEIITDYDYQEDGEGYKHEE